MSDGWGYYPNAPVGAAPAPTTGGSTSAPPIWRPGQEMPQAAVQPSWAPPPAPPRRSRRAWWVAGLLGALLGVGLGLRATGGEEYDDLEPQGGVASDPRGWSPLYLDTGGQPARWNPCRPIHYVVNTRHAPPSGPADLAAAIKRIEKVSGLRFVLDGPTDEEVRATRASAVTDARGDLQWAPLLVTWEPMGTSEGIEGAALPVALDGPQGGVIVTGQLTLNSDLLLPPGFGPGLSQGLVLLHELGHVLGLAHVDDPGQLMYPTVTTANSGLGAGDRAGFVALGRAGGCRAEPPAHQVRLRGARTG